MKMTTRERRLAERNGVLDQMYSDRVVTLIRERYSLHDELSLQRQREKKPDEWAAYDNYCEECKAAAKIWAYGE
jgi:hypothetical protein